MTDCWLIVVQVKKFFFVAVVGISIIFTEHNPMAVVLLFLFLFSHNTPNREKHPTVLSGLFPEKSLRNARARYV